MRGFVRRPDSECAARDRATFGVKFETHAVGSRRLEHQRHPLAGPNDALELDRGERAVLEGQAYIPGSWAEHGIRSSMQERRADEASRDVLNWLKCFFMQDRVGETFEGTISAVTSFGIFVTLDDIFIDGLVHISELGRDYFHDDQARHAITGERGGRVFRLSDRVQVKVARVDLETSKIDFVLPEVRGEGVNDRPGARK